MWLLSRYIIREFVSRFFLFLIVLIFLFVGIDMLSHIWNIDAPFSSVILYYFFKIPNIALQMIPVSILLATLMLFSYLAKHNELVALYCSGRSLLRIANPMFLVVIFISIISFYFSDYILPITNFQSQKVWMVDILGRGGEFYDSLHQKKVWFRGSNIIYNAHSYDSSTGRISGINIFYFNDTFDMLEHLYAKQSVYNDQGKWVMEDGRSTVFNEGRMMTRLFSKKEVSLREKPEDFKKVETSSDYLTTRRLKNYIVDLENAGLYPAKYKVELYKRYSLAFAGFIMCLIGLPFAVRQHRRGGVALNIGIGFVLVFVYWMLFSVLLSLGVSARINAFLAAWGANILFFTSSLFLIKKIER